MSPNVLSVTQPPVKMSVRALTVVHALLRVINSARMTNSSTTRLARYKRNQAAAVAFNWPPLAMNEQSDAFVDQPEKNTSLVDSGGKLRIFFAVLPLLLASFLQSRLVCWLVGC